MGKLIAGYSEMELGEVRNGDMHIGKMHTEICPFGYLLIELADLKSALSVIFLTNSRHLLNLVCLEIWPWTAHFVKPRQAKVNHKL